MGVAGLRDAFNAVASPKYTCQMAFLTTEGGKHSRLRFRGASADGAPFDVASDLVVPGGDVIVAARATAQKLIEGA